MAEQIIRGNQNTTWLMTYLKNNKTQYPLLSKEEEREMIEKYRNDPIKLRQLLQMHNVQMVFSMAKKYMSKTADYDGLVQDGLVGLAEAANRFELDKNIKFSTYAYMWIMKYMTMNFYGKQVEVDSHSTSLNSPALTASLKSNNGNEVTFENYVNEYIDPSVAAIKTINEEIASNEQTELCNSLLKTLENDTSLSATDREIFVELVYNKEKISNLVEKYDRSAKDINILKKSVLAKLRNILEKDYHINSFDDIG